MAADKAFQELHYKAFRITNIHTTHPDPFNHEADVSDALEICGLVNGVNRFYMAGDLQRKCSFRFVEANEAEGKKLVCVYNTELKTLRFVTFPEGAVSEKGTIF